MGDSTRARGDDKPIRRIELVEDVTARLRKEILDGRFGADGELPVEAELTRTYGVSRTVTREALRTLRSQGLVEVRQGCRPRVKPVDSQVATDSLELLIRRTTDSAINITEVRRPLEAEIAYLAAQRWEQDAAIETLRVAVERQATARTLEQQIAADTHFHQLLAEMTGNPIFPLLLATIAPLLHDSRTKTIGRVGSQRAIDGHQAVLEAVENRDAEAARLAMLRHVDMAKEDLAEDDSAS